MARDFQCPPCGLSWYGDVHLLVLTRHATHLFCCADKAVEIETCLTPAGQPSIAGPWNPLTQGRPMTQSATPQAAAGSLAALYAGSQALPGGAQSIGNTAQSQSGLPQAGLLLTAAAFVSLARYSSAFVLDAHSLDNFRSHFVYILERDVEEKIAIVGRLKPCHAIGHCVVSLLSVVLSLCYRCVTIASVTGYQAPAASQMRAPPGSGNAYAAPPQFPQIHPNPATNAPNINSRATGAVAQADQANNTQGMAIELASEGH